ncbi:hypothetical protein NP142_14230 [Salmonella enterica]|uniref:hypothetical protein n=1 Tax=Salmonella TaxID=590 RepID=UPI000B5F655D|nr:MULTISPECIES: hypothetical protein [Salmonella]ASN57536.1 hypothetical protein CGL53_18535 [Salmonella enterica subsp. enterica serovar Indiana]EEJ2275953.1 hypothetical protein [Salmonella enterica subsp. enterica]MBJ5712937.1 hypothetical protein [Salmonella enterica subsp. enterica serovar Indiana]MBJ6087378.1 hypothetical protein [Salmonella enterica subsp. enterica serovar Indiana]MBM8358772.1 hypothetical protein [Salmonella enterica]
MAAKSIVEIDVNDDKFVSFMEKFKEYQAALDELPEAWRGAAHGVSDSTKETVKAKAEAEDLAKAFSDGANAILSVNSGLDRLNDNLEKAGKNQSVFNKNAGSSKGFLSAATKDAKSLAGHIKDATVSLLSWSGIVGLFTGVLGAGGLFGINRLAATTSSQRFTSLGLGTSIGALDSTAINYQRALANPTSTLGSIRDAQMDLSKRWQFQAMGINNANRSPDQLLPEMIRNARDIFVRNGSTLQGAQAYGLTNFFSLDDLNRFKNMSDEEINAMERRAQKDSRLLQITDQQAKQWQDFNVQLDYSNQSIRNTFVRGLGPLTPALTKLSDALSSAIDTVLQSPELGKWIDGLSAGIQKFGNYLASPEFSTDVDNFMTKVTRMGEIISKVVDWITGKTNITAAGVASGSSMLGNNPVIDPQTGKTYTPGSDDDPHVWSWLKGVKKFFSGGTITPVDPQPANVSAKGRTIADRFNNPTNLRWAEGYGTHNTMSGNFAVFPSLDEGVLAAAKQLQIYGTRGINTVRDIASKWAPSNENDTAEYIRHVVRQTRFNENEKLNLNDPVVLAKLISAMASKEGAGSRVSEGAVIQIFNNTGGNAVVTGAQLGVVG